MALAGPWEGVVGIGEEVLTRLKWLVTGVLLVGGRGKESQGQLGAQVDLDLFPFRLSYPNPPPAPSRAQ